MTGTAAGLRAVLRGPVIDPSSEGYDAARRVWNGAVDRRPAMIACCQDTADVATAIRFARQHGLPVAVRSGGHGVAGRAVCDGGLVIDLRAIRQVRVDPARRLARAGAGALNGEFDAATQQHGLAVTAGIVSHTGLAGLTLGGGIGWLARRFGATCDNLTGAELVTADGEIIEAAGDPVLLWALRGAGANFGVVTRPARCRARSSRVTTPKLAPAPRSAQSRSGSPAASMISPSAVTSSAPVRLSQVAPNRRASQPIPPPRVSPASPVWLTMPAVTARPCRWVAASNSPFRTPAPARASRRDGSTWTWRMARRSITRPPSQTARPATPWPPDRTATGRPC